MNSLSKVLSRKLHTSGNKNNLASPFCLRNLTCFVVFWGYLIPGAHFHPMSEAILESLTLIHIQLLNRFFAYLLFCVVEYLSACVWMCTKYMPGALGGHKRVLKWLWATIWILRIEPRFSAGVKSSLNC